MHGKSPELDRKIIYTFVASGSQLGEDEFYIFKLGWLQGYFAEHYKGGASPQNVKSFHCAIWRRDMAAHLGKWRTITNKFKVRAGF